ncbi:MAG: hypothetical protein A2945_02030 [Candidatus Liptonbacteria bacterium RIFCSPLOWO2_01_FULL_52_25]|uniref:VTT domain-containing protein n=1 Tax=Candidatus Liptonbacteria bacterium RIFCSPLOWO2_01_FULL_52_25 TaxID=1798650 RepID=A0A1G2CEE8_9BACT|nr:MAG: hypothetical protein A2945_02030 [Candidatus Liptonbacteria bacterium RIFCSPLOWO2_01_FULL_52_25]
MSEWINALGSLASQNLFLAFFIVYLATIFLGNVSAFATFWIAFRGGFGAWGTPLALIAIFAAEVSGDLLWYSLGNKLRDTRLGTFIKNYLPRHEQLEQKMQKRNVRYVVLSKFIYASSFPIVFMVGWSRVAFKRFFKTSALTLAVWVPLLMGIAYGLFSGLSPLGAIATFRQFEINFFIGIAAFIVANYFLTKLVKIVFGRWWREENGENE